jgi:hypothetical protein
MVTLQHAIFGRSRIYLLLRNQKYHQKYAIYLEETSEECFTSEIICHRGSKNESESSITVSKYTTSFSNLNHRYLKLKLSVAN